MKKVAIIDYGLGNLFSVQQACKTVGLDTYLADTSDKIGQADGVILPGVGAFGHAMEELRRRELIQPLLKHVSEKKPFLGICLGMQLLLERSKEFGDHKGLGIVAGEVKKFPSSSNGVAMRVPHMGWNSLNLSANSNHPALADFRPSTDVYFVHSYYVELKDKSNELTWTDYAGFRYTSSIVNGNIWAYQFHPEKSGKAGLQLFKNWAQHFEL